MSALAGAGLQDQLATVGVRQDVEVHPQRLTDVVTIDFLARRNHHLGAVQVGQLGLGEVSAGGLQLGFVRRQLKDPLDLASDCVLYIRACVCA